MKRCLVSPDAERDIESIFDYIAEDSGDAARPLIMDVDAAFGLLADMPELGHSREDLTAWPVRFWSLRKSYLIVYRTIEDGVQIARVLDGHRDIAELLA